MDDCSLVPGHLIHSFTFPRVCRISSLPQQIVWHGDNLRPPSLLQARSDATNTCVIFCDPILQILSWKFYITLKEFSCFKGCVVQWKLNVVIDLYWRQQQENVIKFIVTTCIKYVLDFSKRKCKSDATYNLPFYCKCENVISLRPKSRLREFLTIAKVDCWCWDTETVHGGELRL